jgi:hypothetical protein
MKKAPLSVWLSRFAAVLIAALSIARAQVEGPNGHFYQVVLEPSLLWEEARDHAAALTFNGVHGYLATIISAEEDQFIENLRQQAAPGGYGALWVGGSQVGTGTLPTDGWYWVNGEGPIPTSAGGDGYSNWQPGEPNDYYGPQSESYLSVGHFNHFGWNDEPNDGNVQGYVVEYPSRGTTSTVKVAAIDAVATESSGADGTIGIDPQPPVIDSAVFVFSRDGDLSLDLPVFYSVHGTAINGGDYNEIAKSIIIPAGQSEVKLEIVPIHDMLAVVEPMETVGIRLEPSLILTPTAAYYINPDNREAAAVIFENSPPQNTTAEVAIPRSGFSYKAGDPVEFLVALYSELSVTTVNFYVDGMAVGMASDNVHTNGLRFLRFTWPNPAPGTHTLMAHALATSTESTTIQFAVEATPQPTQVGIQSFEPTSPLPDADFAPGYFEVRRSGSTAADLQVFYSVSGTATADVDYEKLQGYVVIPAGKSSAKIVVNAIDDTVDEPTETVIVTLAPPADATNSSYTIDPDHSSAQVNIYDNDEPPTLPTVGLAALLNHTSEDGSQMFARFTISRGYATADPLTVFLQYSGTATPGVDYHKLPEQVVIPAGYQSVDLYVEPISDPIVEGDETVDIKLLAGAYTVNLDHDSDTIVIHDAPQPPLPAVPIVRIETVYPAAIESQPEGGLAASPAMFLVTRLGNVTSDARIFYSIHGTAKNGEDYDLIPDSVVIPAGRSTAEIRINPISDTPSLGHRYEIVMQSGLTWLQASNLAKQKVYLNSIGHLATITSAEEDQKIETLRQQAGGPVLWVGGFQAPDEMSIRDGWQWDNDEGPIPGTNGGNVYANWLPGEPNDYWGAGSENGMVIGWLNSFGWNDQGVNVGAAGFVVEYDVEDPVPGSREPMETVGIRLEPSPALTPMPSYLIEENRRSAAAVIFDGQPPVDGALEVAIPSAGDLYAQNTGVEFLAMAYHPLVKIGTVDFYVDDVKVGTSTVTVDPTKVGGLVAHRFTWNSPVPGQHILQARATVNGVTLSSTRIAFSVQGAANASPIVRIGKPSDGATFLETDSIRVVAEASDSDGTVAKIDLLLDGAVIASQTGARFEQDLKFEVGKNTLTARATDNAGAVGTSAPVNILVRHPDTVAFVHRELPGAYTPGVTFAVELRADPPEGTFAYAVEDRPPANWIVTDISDDGFFDKATGKVKFGPFIDADPRTLTYHIRPPANTQGAYEFSGSSAVNGAVYPITGDTRIELATQYHPADTNQDFNISLAEVTAYTAAWKRGQSWPTGPVPIPLNYVTRAHLIWQHGEAYRFEPSAGAPPACWLAGNSGPGTLSAAAIGVAQRFVPAGSRSSATPAQVQITVTPPGGASGYAIEEKPPYGWTVTNISNEGVFDAATGTIRWGVFADTTTRTLTYSVIPPATVASVGVFGGQLSYDGQLIEIGAAAGLDNSVTVNGTSPIRITAVSQTATGVSLNVSGPIGQTAVIETSSDFVNWTEVKSIFIPNGSVNCTDETAVGGNRFYRLRAQ